MTDGGIQSTLSGLALGKRLSGDGTECHVKTMVASKCNCRCGFLLRTVLLTTWFTSFSLVPISSNHSKVSSRLEPKTLVRYRNWHCDKKVWLFFSDVGHRVNLVSWAKREGREWFRGTRSRLCYLQCPECHPCRLDGCRTVFQCILGQVPSLLLDIETVPDKSVGPVYVGFPNIPFLYFDQVVLPAYEANAKLGN